MHRIIFMFPFILICILIITPVSGSRAEDSDSLSPKIGPFLRKEILESRQNSHFLRNRKSSSEKISIVAVLNADHLKILPETVLADFRKKVEALGGIIGTHAYNKVQVTIPAQEIETLAGWPEIRVLKKPVSPRSRSVISEGRSVIKADEWHSSGLSGKGVKAGVIDMGFYGYSGLLGTDLPQSVTTKIMGASRDFLSYDHGTACAEIVYDIAPEAQMFLVNAGDWDVDFHNAVGWLESQGVNVISSSIGINYSIIAELIYEIAYGSSFSSYYASLQLEELDTIREQWKETIDESVSKGITWVQAAGNDGKKRWKSEFKDTDGDKFLNFSATENGNEIVMPDYFYYGIPVYVVLAWGEGDTTDDYDLYITDQYGRNITNSTFIQAEVPFFPMEVCLFYPRSGVKYYARVEKYDAPDQVVSLNIGADSFASFKYYLPHGTVKMAPPADNPNVITVGAVPWDNPYTIESYSSQGPNADDVIKPDLVAPDAVSTRTYETEGFPGTSAAAPHTAGVCALVKQAYPDYTPAQIKAYLEKNALDLGQPGKDNVFGSGLVMLPSLSDSCIPVPDNFDLNICADYMGTSYTFTLEYFPDDPSGIYWKMDIPTFAQAGSGTGGCIMVGAALDLNLCAEYQGIRYRFTLNYVPMPDDPAGIYWEMDVSTFTMIP
ncbi:MAG: S8 family serine peptidase [Desulfococcaceae bacterium]